jgi:hypothetical protein
MPSHIDYVIAAGVFLGAFLFLTAFVGNYASSSFAAIQTTNLRENALAVLSGVERNEGGTKITDFGLGTDAYSFQLILDNRDSQAKNDSSSFKLSDAGYGSADKNSVSIQDGDSILQFALGGDLFTFNAEAPPGKKAIAVWFDDDSAFEPHSTTIFTVPDEVNHTLGPVERSRVVQYKLLQALSALPYGSIKEGFDFRLRLISTSGQEYFSYGLAPPQSNVIALQRPALFQTATAGVIKGYMVAEVW